MFNKSANSRKLLLATAATLSLFAFANVAEAGARGGAAWQNKDGGTTAVRGAARQGPYGGTAARGRVTKTDGEGNAATASGGAFKGPNGASGARGGSTTVDANGNATRRGGFAAQGARGSVQSEGGTTRNADGTYSGGRSTTATGVNGSVTSKGSWNSTDGYSRDVTCKNAAGAAVACPSR
jgi:hypothetical protein